MEFNDHRPNVKFIYKSNKENITFFDLNVGLSRKKLAFHPLLKDFGNIANTQEPVFFIHWPRSSKSF